MSKNPYKRIPAFVPEQAELVHAVIETPRGTRHKFAFEPQYGVMLLKQTIAEGLAWPYDYGFIPQTLGEDGDPLDVLVLNETPLFPGCVQRARLIGAVLLEKNGEENDRFIACPTPTAGTALPVDRFADVADMPEAMLHGIVRFLIEYSAEEGHSMTFKGVVSKEESLRRIEAGRVRYENAAR